MAVSISDFFAFCVARERLRIAKDSGFPKPWTHDTVLANNYFCNIFREDDRTTRWFRENIREPLRDDWRVLLATTIFRWFNYIPTGELIRPLLLGEAQGAALVAELERVLRPLQQRGAKLFTGAFIVKSPNGCDKLTGILRCVEQALATSFPTERLQRLSGCHEVLQQVPFLGPFMAYQIVCDLRFTSLLENAPDINLWTAAGPGSARGLAWLDGGAPLSYTSALGQDRMVQRMRNLLIESKKPEHWPFTWREWELSTVQHSLCEFDKYQRAKAGESMKRRYPTC